jgi:hypothetical protein
MQVRIRTTGAVMFESELRAWLQQTGGPSYDTLTPEVMEAIGVDPVFEGPQATGGTVYQYSQRDGVEQISGNWYTKYILGPVFADTTVDGVTTTAAEAEAAYKATKDAEQSASVRTSRNDKLAECDWTQLADSTADKTVWATYRQLLRDVTVQDGFPWNVTWPEAP